ncbi:MAG: hypothetical protein KY466_11150 [Gemmatimonadetes bacterium]|nr:hypothetical protein [Gemmatimonadota bacterium]
MERPWWSAPGRDPALRAGLTIVMALLWACGPSGSARDRSGDASLTVEPEVAQPGDSVVLLLRNTSREAIGYNLCTSRLERRDEGDWLRLPPDRVCTMELRTLPPGEVARYALELPADLAAGSYRYLAMIARLEARSRDTVVTERFEVVR